MNRDSRDLLDLELERIVDRVCEQFEDELRRGNLPALEDYMSQVPPSAVDDLARELTALIRHYAVIAPEEIGTISAGSTADLPAVNRESSQLTTGSQPPLASQDGPADFVLLELIGRGGMGTVHRALQKSTQRVVALKFLSDASGGPVPSDKRKASLERFRREATATARIQHPNIVTIYEVSESEARPFYAMQFIDGVTLAQLVADHPLPGRLAARYLCEIATAVHEMHRAGVVHRDLKPSNILVEKASDRPLVADLGLAKLIGQEPWKTISGECFGSPSYMSPEQVRDSSSVTAAADIYGLGATLYHLITGRPPFLAATVAETLHQVLLREPIAPRQLDPSIDLDLSTICMKCLDKSTDHRYPSALELSLDLQRYLDGVPVKARPITKVERLRRWVGRNRLVAGAALSTLIVALVGTAVSAFFYNRASQSALAATNATATGRRQLARASIVNAQAATSLGGALAWLSHGLELDGGDARTEFVDRVRFAAELERNATIERIWFPREQPEVMAASADGSRIIVSGCDSSVQLYGLELNTQPATLDVGAEVNAVQISTDGRLAITASVDGVLRAWNTTSRENFAKQVVHDPGPTICSMTPDGQYVCSGDGRFLVVWRLASEFDEVVRLEHSQPLVTCQFAGDGRYLLTTCTGGEVTVWDWNQKEAVRQAIHEQTHPTAQINEDGKFLVVIDDDKVKGYALSGMDTVFSLPTREPVTALAVCPDGKCFAIGHSDGRLVAYSSAGIQLHECQNLAAVTHIRYSRDGSLLVAICADMSLHLWNADTGTQLMTPALHGGKVVAAAFLDGDRIVTCSDEPAVRIWRRPQPSAVTSPTCQGISCTKQSDDGRSLLVGGQDTTAEVIDLASGKAVTLDQGQQVTCGDFDTNQDQVLIGCIFGEVRRWSLSKQAVESSFSHGARLYALSLSQKNRRIATAGEGSAVKLWDADTLASVGSFATDSQTTRWVGFSSDGNHLAAAAGMYLHVWKPNSDDAHLLTMDCGAGISQAEFDPLSRYLLAATGAGRLVVFELRSGRVIDLVQAVSTAPDPINVARFDESGDHILVGLRSGITLVVDVASREVRCDVRHHRSAILAGCFDWSGQIAITADRQGLIQFWDTVTGEIVRSEQLGRDTVRDILVSRRGSSVWALERPGTTTRWKVDVVTNKVDDLQAWSQILTSRKADVATGLKLIGSAETSARWAAIRNAPIKTSDATLFPLP